MNIEIMQSNGIAIAAVRQDTVLLTDEQTALDFMMTVKYETDCSLIVLNKEAISKDFFILSTGLAGKILQKFINYNFKFAIVGDFSGYTSKPLRDFIYECNHGRDIFFVSTEQEAMDRLSTAM